MSIKVTFEFDNIAEAQDFLDNLGAEAGSTATAGEKAKRGRGRPPKAAPVDPTPAAGATAASVATPAAIAVPATAQPATTAAAAPAETVAVPFSALVEPLTALADKDLEAAQALLAKYGAQQARELKPEQFGAFLAEVNAALSPKAAARPSLI